ncbi:MAG: hypothetical protein KGL39_16310 [Patescibacteria group bacterium]|nr:hypothetical protein [Patescibacteria group bacterium]
MTNLTVTCGSCGAAFEVDARKAGQSVPCANCHARIDVPGGDRASDSTNAASQSPPRKITDLAIRAFAGLPAPSKLAVVGLACLMIGYWIGMARIAAVRYSAADMQKSSNRAVVAEQSLATMTDKYTAMEAERSRYKVAAESREKDVASIRQRMNDLRAEKGVPEWASAEAWAKAKDELAAAQSLAAKNADLEKQRAADDREIARLRGDLAAIAEKSRGHASKHRGLQADWDADRNVDPAAKRAADHAVRKAMGDEFSEVLWRRIRGGDDRRWLCAGKVSRKIGDGAFREERVTLTMQQERGGDWSVIDLVFWTEK